MKEDALFNLDKAKGYLMGLKLIADNKNQAFLDQILFHINEVNHSMGKFPVGIDNKLESLRKSIVDSLSTHFEKMLLSTEDLSSMNIGTLRIERNLTSLNNLVCAQSEIIEMVGLFPFRGSLSIGIKEERLELSGFLNWEKWSKDLKLDVYRLLRLLISKRIIPTYELDRTKDGKRSFDLKLVFDFSNNPNEVFLVDLTEKNGLFFTLSNVFANYAFNPSYEFENKHPCVEIHKDLSITKWEQIPANYLENYSSNPKSKGIYHFHFLFRPFSIIIPNKGKLIPTSRKTNFTHTGCATLGHGKDKSSHTFGNPQYHIDLFSLLVSS